MKTALNIGLENNPRSVEEIVNALRVLIDYDLAFRLDIGEYQGQQERTLIVLLEHPNMEGLRVMISNLASALDQECIALYNYDASEGELVYGEYHRGAVMKFDMKYFIEL